jgi:hypothetical protein
MTAINTQTAALIRRHIAQLGDVANVNIIQENSIPVNIRTIGKVFVDSFVVMYSEAETTFTEVVSNVRDMATDCDVAIEDIKRILRRDTSPEQVKIIREQTEGRLERSQAKNLLRSKHHLVKVTLGKRVHTRNARRLLIKIIVNAFDTKVYLHDYDLTQDLYGANTVDNIKRHLLSTGVARGDIVIDPKKLGEHCIVWYEADDTKNKIRYKLYNKDHQMLTSCAVRKPYGTLIGQMFAGLSPAFIVDFWKTRDTSITRFEITLPYRCLLSVVRGRIPLRWQLYEIFLKRIVKLPMYHTSRSFIWSQIIDRINDIVIIFVRDKGLFAQARWYNSITGKIQGTAKSGTSEQRLEDLVKLWSAKYKETVLAIYDTPNDTDPHIKIYRRSGEPTFSLLPGLKHALYPTTYNLRREGRFYLDPEEIGLNEHNGIALGWLDDRRPPTNLLSSITLEDVTPPPAPASTISATTKPHSAFRSDYTSLDTGKEYTVVAYREDLYREARVILCETRQRTSFRSREGTPLYEMLKHAIDRNEAFTFRVVGRTRGRNLPRGVEVRAL